MSNIYTDELVRQKAILVNNINNKGITASSNEKYNTLIDKVSQIVNLKGESRILNKETVYAKDVKALQIDYPESVPSETKEISVQLSSKNLITYPYNSFELEQNGLTATINSDKSITVNGTATADTLFIYAGVNNFNIPAGTYILTGCPTGGSNTTYCQVLGSSDYMDIGSGVTRTYTSDIKQNVFIKIFSGYTADNLVFKPQLELGSTATAYTPYVSDFTASKVTRYGKNLFDKSLVKPTSLEDSGALHTTLIETLDNGWILQGEDGNQKGNSSYNNGWFRPSYAAARFSKGIKANIGQTYTLSYDITLLEKRYPDSTYEFWGTILTPSGKGASYNHTYSLTENVKRHITVSWKATVNEFIFPVMTLNSNKVKIENIQIELGSTATDYTPFVSSTEYTANADGTVEGVKSLSPVTSLICDDNVTMTVTKGTYKELLPSKGKNGVTEIWQEI